MEKQEIDIEKLQQENVSLQHKVAQQEKLLEKALYNEKSLTNIFNSLQDAYFETNFEGKFLRVSPSAAKLFGFSSTDEMLNTPVVELYKNESDRIEMIKQLKETGSLIDFICQGQKRDGTVFWVSMNIQYHYNKKGAIIGPVGMARDITRRKVDEEKIKKHEEELRHIYDNAIEGIFRTTLNGKILMVNKSTAQILGFENEKEVVAKINDSGNQIWLNPEDRINFINLVNTNGKIKNYECQFRRKDGSKIWVSLNSQLICSDSGEKLYYQGFFEDITDRKNKEEEIRKRIENLEWHLQVAIQRELKMVELKSEVNELLIKSGKEKKYDSI